MEEEHKRRYDDEEQYIQSESTEISVGEYLHVEKIFSFFPALENKNYQLYFAGQLVSLIGTWLQIVAEGYLVYTLTHSAILVGAVTAIASIPTLLFSLFGGVIVDRFPKKNILLFTQAAAMLLALIYGILTLIHINVFEISVLAFLLGVVTAVDSPARNAFISEMLTPEQRASAIALNSGAFNAARVVGPAFAGFLIALVTPGGAFLLNGISYIAVIFALFVMQVDMTVANKQLRPMEALKEGVRYSFSHPLIRTLLIFTGVVSIFGWSYSTLMPVIADKIFHVGPSGLGYLYAAAGLGALVATFIVSGLSKRFSPMIFIIGGNTLFAISIMLFTFTTKFELALLLLFFAGVGLLSQFTMLNATIQNMVTDEVRGRVMSIYVLMFLGLSPLGNFEIGWVSEKFGLQNGIRLGAVIVLIFGVVIYLMRKKILVAYKEYKKNNV